MLGVVTVLVFSLGSATLVVVGVVAAKSASGSWTG
jgi:hypothetical protein